MACQHVIRGLDSFLSFLGTSNYIHWDVDGRNDKYSVGLNKLWMVLSYIWDVEPVGEESLIGNGIALNENS